MELGAVTKTAGVYDWYSWRENKAQKESESQVLQWGGGITDTAGEGSTGTVEGGESGAARRLR